MPGPPIVERKVRLDGGVSEFACEGLLVVPGERAVLRYVFDRDWVVHGIRLPRGGTTIAHYWLDRPYNVYHWLDPSGATLGYYFNVADGTSIDEHTVSYRDLVVDVLLRTSGAIDVLDEDELPTDLESAARKTIASALEALVTNGKRLAAEIERESRRLL